MVRHHRALCLVPRLLSKHSYDVANTLNATREQEIEVTDDEADALIRNFERTKSVELRWNHGLNKLGNTPIGKILDVYKMDGGLFAIAEQYDDVINRVVEAGGIDHVSMSHRRPARIEDYTILEVSLCHTGARPGSGIVDLTNPSDAVVSCSEDSELKYFINVLSDPDLSCVEEMSEQQQPAPQVQQPAVAIQSPAPAVAVEDPIDHAGFEKFKAQVLRWQRDGVLPDDHDPKTDGSIAEYQLRRYARNKFLPDHVSDFLMNSLANEVERERDDKEKNMNQFASLAQGLLKKVNKTSNQLEVTEQQKEEARRRLEELSPSAIDGMSDDVINNLCAVSASLEAMTPMEGVEKSEAVRLKEMDLQIEEKKLEVARLNAQTAKREAKLETKKHDQKMETLASIEDRLRKKSRFAVNRGEEDVEMKPEKPRPRASGTSGASYRLDRYGPDAFSTWKAKKRDPIWGKPKDNPPEFIPNIREMAAKFNVPNAGQRLPQGKRMSVGNRDVICSADYEDLSKRETWVDHPFNRNLDAAVLLGDVADPTKMASNPKSRVYQLTYDAGQKFMHDFDAARGIEYFDPSNWRC